MTGWVNFNGSLEEQGTALFTAGSRAFRYGDGLFETMRALDGNIRLRELHFERLFEGMARLQIKLPITDSFLQKQVMRTIEKNKIKGEARVRLTVFRGEGGLYETDGPGSGYLIQAWSMQHKDKINENGLVTGVYTAAAKNCDALANIKSNNYLVYVMAALHAKNNLWNDCIVLNNHGRVCEATIANIFWIKGEKIFTPPLTEGCVAGVMRRHLLETLPGKGFVLEERAAISDDIENADEVFLTNAVSGIRWVREMNGHEFGNKISTLLFRSTF